jgi:nucleotide-binding universal stress UspA family protein
MIGLFHKILVPVDFSPCSDEAFKTAVQLARTSESESEVVMLHVIDTGAIAAFNRLGLLAVPSDATAQRRRLRHQARLKSRQLLESVSTEGIAVRRIVLEGTPFVEIAKLTRQEQVDLIVLGSYGGRSESMDKIFFGATAEKVVRTAGCPVLTVPLPPKPKR